MKHLFYIHSYITYLVSLKVIEYRNLSKNDCVFLINRKIIIKDEIDAYSIDEYCSEDALPISMQILESRNKLKTIDTFIARVTKNGKFHLYLPNTRKRFTAVMISHKNCEGYSLIEEGLASYFYQEEINNKIPSRKFSIKERINKYLSYGNRLPELKFYDSGYSSAYAISDYAFPKFKDRVVLKSLNFDNRRDGIWDNQHILVFDALVEFKFITTNDFLTFLANLVNYFKTKSVEKVYYKLHPEQIKEGGSAVLIQDFLKKIESVEFLEMPQTTILEEVMARNNNLSFYIVLSSVGLYAAFCGHKVYCFKDNFKSANENFLKLVKNMPPVFSSSLQQVQF